MTTKAEAARTQRAAKRAERRYAERRLHEAEWAMQNAARAFEEAVARAAHVHMTGTENEYREARLSVARTREFHSLAIQSWQDARAALEG